MEKKAYHHGNLHETLLEESMTMIHEEGRAQFSLRKLAKRVGVSPTACYNHFSNIDELLSAISEYINIKFTESIKRGFDLSFQNPDRLMVELGKEYVGFFADNPHYFSFIYENLDCDIILTDTDFISDYTPSLLFRNAAIDVMKNAHIPESHYRDNIVVMWATVHGLAAMANMKAFHYSGDWRALTDQILTERLKIF